MVDLWRWGLVFRVLSLVLALSACGKVEEKKNTTIAIEDRVVDLTVHSDRPDQYNFLDENFANLYSAEQRQRKIFTTFAFLAIFIACLGLFGLSAFAISQRVKEIG